MTNFTFSPLGTVSAGTHNLVDLAQSFVSWLVAIARTDDDKARAREAKLVGAACMDILAKRELTEEDMLLLSEFVNDKLPNQLNKYALPYTTFSAHCGDGSDFGFWVDEEAIAAGVEDRTIHKSSGSLVGADPYRMRYLLKESGSNTSLVAMPSGIVIWTC